MQELKAKEQKLAEFENLMAELGRMRVKAEEDLEALRKKEEKLLAEPGSSTPADLAKVQAALEAKEKDVNDRALAIGKLKPQADATRKEVVELHQELFRAGMKPKTDAIVGAAGDVAHRVLVHLDELAREVRERVLEPNAVFQSEVGEVLNTKEGKAQRVTDRLRGALEYMLQARAGLEAVLEEATR